MNKIGRKIYYLKKNGLVLFDTGEKIGTSVKQTTYEDDIKAAGLERLHQEGKIDVIELEYGQYKEEFERACYIKVNPKTKKLKFYLGDRVYKIEFYNGEEKYTKEEVEYIYDQYVNFNLRKILEENIPKVSFRWVSLDDLVIREDILVRSWKNYYKDGYLEDSSLDRTLLARDILKHGTYWPILIENNGNGLVVHEGNHRVISAKLFQLEGGWPKNRRFLAIEVFGDYPRLKKSNPQVVLPKPVRQRIPFVTKFPSVSRDDKDTLKYMEEQAINFVDDKGIMIELYADTYEEFFMYNQMIPHWLRNLLYEYKTKKGIIIKPSKILNDEEEWNKWSRGGRLCSVR